MSTAQNVQRLRQMLLIKVAGLQAKRKTTEQGIDDKNNPWVTGDSE